MELKKCFIINKIKFHLGYSFMEQINLLKKKYK